VWRWCRAWRGGPARGDGRAWVVGGWGLAGRAIGGVGALDARKIGVSGDAMSLGGVLGWHEERGSVRPSWWDVVGRRLGRGESKEHRDSTRYTNPTLNTTYTTKSHTTTHKTIDTKKQEGNKPTKKDTKKTTRGRS